MSAVYKIDDMDWSIYSDMYKDAYGFRPRTMPKTEEQYHRDMAMFSEMIERNTADEKAFAEKMAQEFEQLITNTIAVGAKDRKTALRWVIQDEEFSCGMQDIEHFVWKQHFLFTDYGKNLIKEIVEIVKERG